MQHLSLELKKLKMLHSKTKSITLSVVSHGHAELIRALVEALSSTSAAWISKVVVTNNSPSSDKFSGLFRGAYSLPCEMKLIENVKPMVFGANQNQAFRHCDTEYFCIINPDIVILQEPFDALLQVFSQADVGIAYPSQVDETHLPLDFERELATPLAVCRRHLLGQRYRQQTGFPVDWVSGAFMVFNSSIFGRLGGFDEGYFMYCEDVDICLRAQLAGYKLGKADATVMHRTRRRTLKSLEHLQWHVLSLLRLWRSAPYRAFKKSRNQ